MQRAHEHRDVDGGVVERQLLGAADEIAGAAAVVLLDRLRQLRLGDLHAGDAGAALGERAHERAAATADVDDVLCVRRGEPFEHRQIADLLAAHGSES